MIPHHVDAPRPGGRALRAARSAAAGLVCVTAAAVGHRIAGGPLPVEVVVPAFAGTGLIAWSLSSRRITPAQLVGLLLLCQIAVHLVAAPDDMSMGPAMIAAHVVATAASAAALARGERFVWQLAERLALRPLPMLRAVAAVTPSYAPLVAVVLPPLRDVRLAHSRWLRGPPVGLA